MYNVTTSEVICWYMFTRSCSFKLSKYFIASFLLVVTFSIFKSLFTSSVIFAFMSVTVFSVTSISTLVYIPLSRECFNSIFVLLPYNSFIATMYKNFKPLLYIFAPILSSVLINFTFASSFNM